MRKDNQSIMEYIKIPIIRDFSIYNRLDWLVYAYLYKFANLEGDSYVTPSQIYEYTRQKYQVDKIQEAIKLFTNQNLLEWTFKNNKQCIHINIPYEMYNIIPSNFIWNGWIPPEVKEYLIRIQQFCKQLNQSNAFCSLSKEQLSNKINVPIKTINNIELWMSKAKLCKRKENGIYFNTPMLFLDADEWSKEHNYKI